MAQVKLDLLTDIHLLPKIEKVIRRGIFILIIDMQKLITNSYKDYEKNKESSSLQYWDVNNS